ncbi:MAG: DeoR/GlpR family DNA-binding transcription regulator [Anaerolineae bacterium]|nr:DeoR/GlpR family DNA-binding transcription regulator [Anaerolineae bacterium]
MAEARRSLMAAERRARITEFVVQQGSVRVSELSALFQVSEVTIRNDLDLLHKQGSLIRDHGGAIAEIHATAFIDFARRTRENLAEKQRIGRAAALLVQPDETIIMDAGTTVMEMARSLSSDLSLTVVTNGLNVASRMGMSSNAHVILLGGCFNRETISTLGTETERELDNVRVQRVFLGTHAMDIASGLTDTAIEVAHVKRRMVEAAREVILLADSSKWGRIAFAKTIPFSEVDIMITDAGLPDQAQKTLRSLGVELILV